MILVDGSLNEGPDDKLSSHFITARNSSCGKLMFSQAFVIPSVHSGVCLWFLGVCLWEDVLMGLEVYTP